jgi:hypothetical protein
MIQLPQDMRDMLVERIDERIETGDVVEEIEDFIAGILEILPLVAEDCDVDGAEDLVAALESSGDLDISLAECLQEQYERNLDDGMSGEEIVSFVEKLCEIEWSEPDDPHDPDDPDEV